MTRIYQPTPLHVGDTLFLDEAASHHVARVLRMNKNEPLTIFNGSGGEYLSKITDIQKKMVVVNITEFSSREAESSLELYLAQGISRGEKMDYTIQKAVELGVTKIIPILTEYCNVKLDASRLEKKLQHWRSIIISACEQCGRNKLPEIVTPETLDKALPKFKADFSFVLSPTAEQKLNQYNIENHHRVILLIGPEGGLSEKEIMEANRYKFLPLNLGPRILRTETAAISAISALQCYFGDMGA